MSCLSSGGERSLPTSSSPLPFKHTPYTPVIEEVPVSTGGTEKRRLWSSTIQENSFYSLSLNSSSSDSSCPSFSSKKSRLDADGGPLRFSGVGESIHHLPQSTHCYFKTPCSLDRSEKSPKICSRTGRRLLVDDESISSIAGDRFGAKVKIQLRYGDDIFLIPRLSSFSPSGNGSEILKRYVVVEGDRGEDMGCIVDILEKLPAEEMYVSIPSLKEVLRFASVQDMILFMNLDGEELVALEKCRQTIRELQLEDIDVHRAYYQFDKKKLTFEYTSNSYIDFSRLIRSLHTVYKCRIWMNQTNRSPTSVGGGRKDSSEFFKDKSVKRWTSRTLQKGRY